MIRQAILLQIFTKSYIILWYALHIYKKMSSHYNIEIAKPHTLIHEVNCVGKI